MGVEKLRRPFRAPSGTFVGNVTMTAGGVGVPVETLTSTASVISAYGMTVLSVAGSTADKVFTLPRPAQAGAIKYLTCNTTGVQKVSATLGGSTASGFFVGGGGNAAGSTYRTIVFSSLSTKQRFAQLVATSTTTWALVSKSTGTTLAG